MSPVAVKMLLPVVAVNLFRVSSVSAFHLFQVFHLFQALRHPPSWKMLVIEVGGDSHDRQLVRVAVEGVPWPVRASIGGGGIVAHDVGASRCNGIVEASSRAVA